MHDSDFDYRFDPKVAPLLPSLAVRVLGSVILAVATLAPVAFVVGLVGEIGLSGV